MIQGTDSTAGIHEPKSFRKDLRLKPSVIEAIETAARSVGMDTSTFITSVAYREAQAIESAYHQSVLSDQAFDRFAAAVDKPAVANDALAQLFKRRAELLSEN